MTCWDRIIRRRFPENQRPWLSFRMAVIDSVILAAGSSSRMGRPKQQLLINGTPLLTLTINAHVQSGALRKIVVVLGSGAETITPIFSGHHPTVIINDRWETGMGSSLKCGVNFLLSDGEQPDGILVSVCDQPLLTPEVIRSITALATPGKIIASLYSHQPSGTTGPPALFGQAFFNALLGIPDGSGARLLLTQHPENVITAPFPGGATDLDTPDDYQRFIQQQP